ncbi:GNAT family N-acetyltransferase [Paenibacillus radicis (ex Gao et al. 2016)]|uniref:N-acetyltransferase n=1 Tax=Paenibacillus radicis (ex Gao et al. 2016) TaxID=1737354 RepID=A0A917M0H9_9BACL|nr:GNAT family N-acetyltransferase [Paenibacillus radicis (ex Gao et al. 2016)]GGG68589.1 N-acetyltransferase [Paenibacillus radicis (ex Gao et al. 2016)]
MIQSYDEQYKSEVIQFILSVQNGEQGLGITIEEQIDIVDIREHYLNAGGGFWIALADQQLVGSIGLMKKTDEVYVLKKFFVHEDYRGKEIGIGKALYDTLLQFAADHGARTILLDSPSVAARSHRFYKKNGFKEIAKEELPVSYAYPDRDSLLFQLDLD